MLSPTPASPSHDAPKEDVLRTAFVEMLFALAVGDVAIHAAEIVQAAGVCREKLPAIAHLVLAIVLMAVSFVGWRQSQSPGMKEQVKTIISWQFLGLLMDVVIVIEYFVLTELVEVRKEGDQPTLFHASATAEAKVCVVVFLTYALWDLITDVAPPGCVFPPAKDYPVGRFPPRSLFAKARRVAAAVFVSVFASGLAAVLTALVWLLARNDVRAERSWMYDAALICVVGLFRLFKLWENKLAPFLGVDHLQAFRKEREVTTRHRVAFWILAPSYFVFALVASLGRW